MLKITKGLNPLCGVITTYTDDRGNEYVRVRTEDEDFGIAAHDYIKDGKAVFSWDDAMHLTEQEGLTMLTLKQVGVYKEHLTEINNKLKEIGGEALKSTWYWTSSIYSGGGDIGWIYQGVSSWIYRGVSGETDYSFHYIDCKVRPILNLQ